MTLDSGITLLIHFFFCSFNEEKMTATQRRTDSFSLVSSLMNSGEHKHGEGTAWTSCDQQFLITNLRHNHSDRITRELLKKYVLFIPITFRFILNNCRFYYGLITENFPFEDELDPFEVWEEHFHPKTAGEESTGEPVRDVIFEILLFYDAVKDSHLPLVEREIIGGSVCEFFSESKCGLISYFVVSTRYGFKIDSLFLRKLTSSAGNAIEDCLKKLFNLLSLL